MAKKEKEQPINEKAKRSKKQEKSSGRFVALIILLITILLGLLFRFL